jgi:hypothetical protein
VSALSCRHRSGEAHDSQTNPTSEPIQNALATWIASQTPHIPELSTQAQNMPVMRGVLKTSIPDTKKLEQSIENCKRTEPILKDAIDKGLDFDKELEHI